MGPNVNIPIAFYSSALLILLLYTETGDEGRGSSAPAVAGWLRGILTAACWLPLLATLCTLADDALRAAAARLWGSGGSGGEATGPRLALVTGAGRGIGREIAVGLAGRGVHLVVVGRNLKRLQQLEEELGISCPGVEVFPLRCDLSDPSEIDRLISSLEDKEAPPSVAPGGGSLLGAIDVLVNNAGLGDSSDFFHEGCRLEKVHAVLSLNVVGTIHLTHRVGRAMRHRKIRVETKSESETNANNETSPPRRSKRIVFVSSIMGLVPGNAGCAVYAASKAFQRSFCASLGRELELEAASSSGCYNNNIVSVTCVLPGAVASTGFCDAAGMEDSPVFWLPRFCRVALSPREVAGAVVQTACLSPFPPPREIVVGVLYRLTGHVVADLFPARATQILGELLTRPWGKGAARRGAGGSNSRSGDGDR